MKFFSVFFLINLCLLVPLHGSENQRVYSFRPRALEPIKSPEVQNVEPQNFVHEEMSDRRAMTRAYVALMNRIWILTMEKGLLNKDFEKICFDVTQYKQQYLKLLQQNKLLSDDSNERNNNFNEDLINQLTNIADKHNFCKDLVPAKVVSDWLVK
jgi:hypothetical protein